MSSYGDDTPILEVTPGDVTVGSEGKVEIINARLAEAVKAAIRLQREQGGRRVGRADTNTYACGLNVYQCKPAATARTKTGG